MQRNISSSSFYDTMPVLVITNKLFRGREHKSSTVAAHTNVVSVQLQDASGEYIGSAHIDEDGNAYPNDNFKKNAEKAKK